MESQRNLQPVEAQKSARSSVLSIWSKSALATAVVAGSIVAGILFGWPQLTLLVQGSDQMSEQQRQERLAAFNSLRPLSLALVSQEETTKALDGMGLNARELSAFQHDLNSSGQSLPN